MDDGDAATGAILIAIGLLAAYASIRGRWAMLALAILYPWDVQVG